MKVLFFFICIIYVLAKSDPAKRTGVKTGMTLRDARSLCSNLNIVPPRYDIYVKSSKAMKEILSEYSMFIESYSIDESWISFKGHNMIYEDYDKLAYEIKDRIFNVFCSIFEQTFYSLNN